MSEDKRKPWKFKASLVMAWTLAGASAAGLIVYSHDYDHAVAKAAVEKENLTFEKSSYYSIFTKKSSVCDKPDDAVKGNMTFTATKQDGTKVTGVVCRQAFWKPQNPYIKYDQPK